MAKYECTLRGEFDEILAQIHSGILEGSASASFEDGSDFHQGALRCAVRVYERYSMFGGNRVSLNITFAQGEESSIFFTAITSGGSQAVLFKVNTVGEETFLDCAVRLVEPYQY